MAINYRVVYTQTRSFGKQYGIYQRESFLFFFSKWRRTHLCNSLAEAILIIKYLKSTEQYKIGSILYEE